MLIVETSIFTKQVTELLSDEEYRRLQVALAVKPGLGPLIKGSGGLRKVRWALGGKGKSGGVRVIYYWAVGHERLLLLYLYPKSERSDLSAHQIKVLRRLVEEEYS